MTPIKFQPWIRRLQIFVLVLLGSVLTLSDSALAFCGFYVAKADASLYNQASKVIIARDRNRTILTMANDFQGSVQDFALVVPVPVPIQKEQVRVGESNILERLDAFSAPRLVEYYDPNPCQPVYPASSRDSLSLQGSITQAPVLRSPEAGLGVTIEAKFSVGEYDILILSAKESDGLATWLTQNDYKIPQGAAAILQPYIRQGMKFFVAKVNLKEFQQSQFQLLRPLQIAYESPKFMLPIRLGMLNASGAQDLIVYVLSPRGRAEVTNYRTVEIPSDAEIPLYVKPKFADFYRDMFKTAYNRQGQNAAFLEYTWDMSNCDPCSAEPLSLEEQKKAGVFWLDQPAGSGLSQPSFPNSDHVFVTRLHVRYTRDKFPEDLMFQETTNQTQFQGRYILRHPATGDLNCEAGQVYRRTLATRAVTQAQTLSQLTGWNLQDVQRQTREDLPELPPEEPFWQKIWP